MRPEEDLTTCISLLPAVDTTLADVLLVRTWYVAMEGDAP
jgi:hypothetical protein